MEGRIRRGRWLLLNAFAAFLMINLIATLIQCYLKNDEAGPLYSLFRFSFAVALIFPTYRGYELARRILILSCLVILGLFVLKVGDLLHDAHQAPSFSLADPAGSFLLLVCAALAAVTVKLLFSENVRVFLVHQRNGRSCP